MKKQLLALMVSAAIFATSPAFAMDEEQRNEGNTLRELSCIPSIQANEYLHWEDRPAKVTNVINQVFEKIVAQSNDHWLCNGAATYGIADVCEKKLVHHLITSNPAQKEFTFLDIGTGDFEWGNRLALKINKFSDIPDDIKVNIIGVRGERYQGPELSVIGKCNIYSLGAFKIENLEAAFKSRNLELTNKIDIIVTNWCFRHLVDPVGTLEQAYNLLKPKTGLFFGDGFYYGFNEESKDLSSSSYNNIVNLLLDLKDPFLLDPYDVMGTIHRFVFKRDTFDSLKLPLKYAKYNCLNYLGCKSQVYSQVSTVFEHVGPHPEWTRVELYEQHKLYGVLDLFNFFKKNNLFYTTEDSVPIYGFPVKEHGFLERKI